MKPILLIILLSAGSVSLAQSSSSLNTVINEDNKTMSIQVEGERNGRVLAYKRTFDITRLSASEKDALKNRVLDSLGVGQQGASPDVMADRERTPAGGGIGVAIPPKPPVPPSSPADAGQPMVTFQCESCTGKVKLMLTSPTEDYAMERDARANTDKRLFPYKLPLSPGEYQLKYYQNGVLQIQSTFTVKQGDSNTVVIK